MCFQGMMVVTGESDPRMLIFWTGRWCCQVLKMDYLLSIQGHRTPPKWFTGTFNSRSFEYEESISLLQFIHIWPNHSNAFDSSHSILDSHLIISILPHSIECVCKMENIMNQLPICWCPRLTVWHWLPSSYFSSPALVIPLAAAHN